MATEAAFKEIPEIFEVCIIFEAFVGSHVTNHLPGRGRGGIGSSNRKSRSVSLTLSATRLLTLVHQQPFENWALRTFAMLSRALDGLVSAMYVQILPFLCVSHEHLAWHIPLHIGCRRFVFCVSSSLYQLSHICNRGQLCLVLTEAVLESAEWLLLVPCLSPTSTCSFVDGQL